MNELFRSRLDRTSAGVPFIDRKRSRTLTNGFSERSESMVFTKLAGPSDLEAIQAPNKGRFKSTRAGSVLDRIFFEVAAPSRARKSTTESQSAAGTSIWGRILVAENS